jgi:Na+-driven multidrug efflux pump
MGIAIATILCQIFNVIYLGYFVLKNPLSKKFQLSYCKLKTKITIDIFKQALPSSMNMLLIGVGFFIIQKYVTGYGANASAGYGIALRIEQIILLPAIGLNTAMLSMTGQNYGAKNFDRIYEAFTTSLKLALFLMVFGSAILFLAGEQMAFLFTRDTDVIKIAGSYLFMAAFLTFIYQVIHQSGSVLSGMKKPSINAFYTLLRLAIIPPFTFYFFSQTLGLGLNGIWWAILCSNIIAAFLIFFHMRYLIKKESSSLKPVTTT